MSKILVIWSSKSKSKRNFSLTKHSNMCKKHYLSMFLSKAAS